MRASPVSSRRRADCAHQSEPIPSVSRARRSSNYVAGGDRESQRLCSDNSGGEESARAERNIGSGFLRRPESRRFHRAEIARRLPAAKSFSPPSMACCRPPLLCITLCMIDSALDNRLPHRDGWLLAIQSERIATSTRFRLAGLGLYKLE